MRTSLSLLSWGLSVTPRSGFLFLSPDLRSFQLLFLQIKFLLPFLSLLLRFLNVRVIMLHGDIEFPVYFRVLFIFVSAVQLDCFPLFCPPGRWTILLPLVYYLFHLAYFLTIFNFFFMFIYFWESASGGGAERERRRNRIWSRCQALSCQHRTQCGARTHSEIMTWAEVRCLIDWVTQAPHI